MSSASAMRIAIALDAASTSSGISRGVPSEQGMARDKSDRADESASASQLQMAASRAACLNSQAENSQAAGRSEEHTSELQSQFHLVCRLLLEKKKNTTN